MEAITAALIDEPEAGVAFDFMADIALPLPIAVIGGWLNLEPASARLLRELSPVIIRMLGTLADPDEIAAGAGAGAALMAEFLPLAADRRTHPGDDLLSFIAADPDVSLRRGRRDRDTDRRRRPRNHRQHAWRRPHHATHPGRGRQPPHRPHRPRRPRTGDRTAATARPGAIHRAHRHHRPHHRRGPRSPPVETVLVVVAAANRDPAVFDQPDQFRLDRSGPAPLSFGYGAHYCLGAAVAQLELTTAIPKILDRQPVLAGSVHWRDTPAIRGPLSVPLIFSGT